MSGCIESKDWDPGSNEGKEKTSLVFCRTGISPEWFPLTSSNEVVLTRSRAPRVPLPCCLSLLSFQNQVSLPPRVPSIHPHALSLAGHPQTLLPSCRLIEASGIEREQGGQQFSVPCLCYSFAKQVQSIQSSSFSKESRRRNRCNVRNQHLVLGTSVPIMTFVNNSRGICI